MRRMIVFAGLIAGLGLGTAQAQQPTGRGRGGGRGTPIQPGESCPPGTTEIRPRSCMAPELPRAEHSGLSPAIDARRAGAHGEDGEVSGDRLPRPPAGPAQLAPKARDSSGAALDSLNVRMMVSADNMSGDRLKTTLANVRASAKMKDRVRDARRNQLPERRTGMGAKRPSRSSRRTSPPARSASARSRKSFGLSIKKPDGSRLKIDDPELDPIWDACARLKLPVFIHTADPQEFFQPIDYTNERWLELALFGDRRYPQDRFPSFES